MYSVFDDYLDRANHTAEHREDTNRFNEALKGVLDDPDFDPDEMGECMVRKMNAKRDDGSPQASSIERCVARTWAVKEFQEDQ